MLREGTLAHGVTVVVVVIMARGEDQSAGDTLVARLKGLQFGYQGLIFFISITPRCYASATC